MAKKAKDTDKVVGPDEFYDHMVVRTEFTKGDEFSSDQDVLDYFTSENMTKVLGKEKADRIDPFDLKMMAEMVILHKLHCDY